MTIKLLVLFLAVGLGGCSSATDKPANTRATKAATLEGEFQEQADPNDLMRTDARQAILDFVSRNLPTWNVKGISSRRFNQNYFTADAEIEKDGKNSVVTFLIERFYPESGDPYWLAMPVNRFTRERLHHLSDDELLKQYNEAREKLDDLQSPPEDDQ